MGLPASGLETSGGAGQRSMCSAPVGGTCEKRCGKRFIATSSGSSILNLECSKSLTDDLSEAMSARLKMHTIPSHCGSCPVVWLSWPTQSIGTPLGFIAGVNSGGQAGKRSSPCQSGGGEPGYRIHLSQVILPSICRLAEQLILLPLGPQRILSRAQWKLALGLIQRSSSV